MTTIKKIAELAGVSQSTVSRVLNQPDYHCSTPETREKIWNAAIELQYVPNEAARNLKSGSGIKKEKTYAIGVLVTRTESADVDPFFSELLHVIETEVQNQFCILSKIWYEPIFSDDRKCRGETLKRAVAALKEDNSKIDGLIVIGRCRKEAMAALQKSFRYVVSVSRNPSGSEIDEVCCDGRKIASLAIEYLVSLGHRKIGYVGECRSESRYQGYLDVLKRHQIDTDLAYVYETRQTEAAGYEVMEQIAKSGDVPTALYCANDITAVGMLRSLSRSQNRYLSVSVIASDDIEKAQFTTPMLTTIALPKEEMGKFAMYLLLDRMRGGHRTPARMLLEGHLIRRASCYNVQDTVDYYI
jgi:DNA-binding LacI/PurR family transcriptional regulator